MPPRRKDSASRITSLDAVMESARRMIDAEGLESFSMRRLAAEMNVGAMTLYGFVRTKEELLEAVAAWTLESLRPISNAGMDWRTRLQLEVEHLYAMLERHPCLTEIAVTQGVPSPGFDRFRESLLAALDDGGVPRERAVEVITVLASLAFGFARVRDSRRAVEGHPEIEAGRLRGLPRAEFPHLTAAADIYATHVSQNAFRHGVRLLIEGLAAEVPQPQ